MQWKLPCLLVATTIISACSPDIGPLACNELTQFGAWTVADAAGYGDIAADVLAMGCDG